MAIELNCAGCGKHYALDEALAGKRARCKQCGVEFRIPAPRPAAPRPSRPAPRVEYEEDDDEGPAPVRPAAGRSKKPRRRLRGELPPLVKVLLILVAVLMAVGSVIVAGSLVATAPPGAAPSRLAMIGFLDLAFVCYGLAIVCFLKTCFLAYEDNPVAGLGTFLLGPLGMLVASVYYWREAKHLFAGYVAGVGGIVLWSILATPHLEARSRPAGGDPSSVTVIVTGLPPGEANTLIMEKLKGLVDPGGAMSIRGEIAAGRGSRFVVSPVRDVRAFADAITFGKVTRVSGREVTVAADPISEEELAAYQHRQQAAPAQGPPPSDPAPPAVIGDIGGRPASGPARAFAAPDPEPPAGADPVTRALVGLKSSDRHKQRQAFDQLRRMAPVDDRREEVHKALQPLLDHEDGFFVNDVISAMASWSTPETVPALIPRTTDSRFGVRWHALEVLGKLGDARAAEAIVGRLKEDGIKAEPALRDLGPAAEPAVVPLLRSPDADLRRKACNVLRDIGGEATLAFMRKARPDPDFSVRVAAQETMQAIAARVGTPPRGR